MNRVEPLCEGDLDHVFARTGRSWESLRGQRLFVTGGGGFIGHWLIESFLYANRKLDLRASALVLSRDPAALLARAPYLAHQRALDFITGDMGSFRFPRGRFPFVLHAATEPAGGLDPLELFERNVGGTRRVLHFAHRAATERFLFTSSGAVYGVQPPSLKLLPEDHACAPLPLDTTTAYGQSKRASEFLCAAHAQRHGFTAVVARCFAFVGPHLPLDRNFAVGNFVRDALAGGPIRVLGNGTPRRSYLYGADLAVWLWTILLRGLPSRAYNVGSEEELSVAELARLVGEVVNPSASVEVAEVEQEPSKAPERYVPSTARAREELGLASWVALREGLRRAAEWARRCGSTGVGGPT